MKEWFKYGVLFFNGAVRFRYGIRRMCDGSVEYVKCGVTEILNGSMEYVHTSQLMLHSEIIAVCS
jgi:hypothetical protein